MSNKQKIEYYHNIIKKKNHKKFIIHVQIHVSIFKIIPTIHCLLNGTSFPRYIMIPHAQNRKHGTSCLRYIMALFSQNGGLCPRYIM